MNYTHSLALLIAGLFFASCSSHYYSPALYKNDIAYQFKPMSSDEEKSANYISGDLNLTNGHNLNDNVQYGMLRFTHAETYDNFNMAIGGYGFMGDYQNFTLQPSDAGYFGNKSFSGLGLRFSGNTYVKNGNADDRLFGIDVSYSKEFGDYADYRTQAQNIPGFYSDASTSVLTAGLTNEIIWQSGRSPAFQYGYRLFFGGVFGNHTFANNTVQSNTINSPYVAYGTLCYSAAYFIQVQQIQAVVQVTDFSAIQLTLGYRF